jgi:hypothetical protein
MMRGGTHLLAMQGMGHRLQSDRQPFADLFRRDFLRCPSEDAFLQM